MNNELKHGDIYFQNDILTVTYKQQEEYVQFARLHIDTYRCSCGSLGRIGYRCSNKECNKY